MAISWYIPTTVFKAKAHLTSKGSAEIFLLTVLFPVFQTETTGAHQSPLTTENYLFIYLLLRIFIYVSAALNRL